MGQSRQQMLTLGLLTTMQGRGELLIAGWAYTWSKSGMHL